MFVGNEHILIKIEASDYEKKIIIKENKNWKEWLKW